MTTALIPAMKNGDTAISFATVEDVLVPGAAKLLPFGKYAAKKGVNLADKSDANKKVIKELRVGYKQLSGEMGRQRKQWAAAKIADGEVDLTNVKFKKKTDAVTGATYFDYDHGVMTFAPAKVEKKPSASAELTTAKAALELAKVEAEEKAQKIEKLLALAAEAGLDISDL